jgi:hypothetical protein
MEMEMERVFQNIDATAFLDKGIFINEKLLENCIIDIELQLEERPEIIIFGKKCKQQRNVGFFSNESIGYKYSKKMMDSKPLSKSMSKLLLIINDIKRCMIFIFHFIIAIAINLFDFSI